MDKVAIVSGAMGAFIAFASTIVSLATESFVPALMGFGLGALLLVWKPFLNFLTTQQKKTQDTTLAEEWEGREKMDEIREIVLALEGEPRIHEGIPLYIKILKYHITQQLGIGGLRDYLPKNKQVFGPYGVFMMEIESNPAWDIPRMYPMLSLKGPNAGEYIGDIDASSWRNAIEELSKQGNAGLITSKFVELKPSLANAAVSQGASLS